jgi:phytoene dehydrogenase-like protein
MRGYDVLIVGGGHNGLVTAAYLARAGRKVLVLERREMVGGCAVTEEVWPGYRVSTGAYLTSLLQERIVRELDLESHGYQVDAKDPAFFSAFPDGRHFFMWQDRARTLEEIRKFSAHDAEVFPAYEELIERLASFVEGLLLTAPPQFPPRGARDFLDYLKLAAKLRGMAARDLAALVKIFTQSAAEFLDEWFKSKQVKVTLAWAAWPAIAAYGDSCVAAWAPYRRPSPRPRAPPGPKFASTPRWPGCWCGKAGPREWYSKTARKSARPRWRAISTPSGLS